MAEQSRRGFFGSILRTVAITTALIYAPSVLAANPAKADPRAVFEQEWEDLRKTETGRCMNLTKDRYVEISIARSNLHPWTFTEEADAFLDTEASMRSWIARGRPKITRTVVGVQWPCGSTGLAGGR